MRDKLRALVVPHTFGIGKPVAMWCPNCRNDVPAIASGDRTQCAQCGQSVRSNSARHRDPMADSGIDLSASSAGGASVGSTEFPLLSDDGWLLDEQVRHLQRRAHVPVAPPHMNAFGDHSDWSTNMASSDLWNSAATAKPVETSKHRTGADPAIAQTRRHKPSLVAWSILSLGLMAFLCGGVLLVWAFVGHRNDLWSLGMPLALVGQFGLLLGLVLQLDHLWQANRRTAETLHGVDERLSEINHATTLLQSSHSLPAQSFYAHLAEGAHPHLLLADLKGQLDILATKMAAQR